MLVKETKNMKTDITVRLFESQKNKKNKTKAFIDLKLDDTLIVKGLSIVEWQEGLFLSFPATKGKDGKYYNSVYSLDKVWRKKLEDACIKKYKEEKKAYDEEKKAHDYATGGGDFS